MKIGRSDSSSARVSSKISQASIGQRGTIDERSSCFLSAHVVRRTKRKFRAISNTKPSSTKEIHRSMFSETRSVLLIKSNAFHRVFSNEVQSFIQSGAIGSTKRPSGNAFSMLTTELFRSRARSNSVKFLNFNTN